MDNNKDDTETHELDLHEVELSELLMVVGSFIFAGNPLSDLDSKIINKLQDLIIEEQEYRLTGKPPNAQVH